MTRVLFWGDAGHTGFGTVTWDLGTRLIARGLDVRFLSMNVSAEPIPHPVGERTWSIDRMTSDDILAMMTTGMLDGWHADAQIIVGDYFATSNTVIGTHRRLTEAFAKTPTFHYVPVEGVDLPPTWGQMWSIVRPVAMTEFGADQLEKILPERPPVVYHGVNTADFYPVSANRPGYWKGQPVTSKEGAKRALRADPDSIIALRTDRYMPRKMYGALIRSMAVAMEQVPELRLALHCRAIDEGGSLHDERSKLPEDIGRRVILTRGHDGFRGLSRADLNVLYNAADLYVTTGAEGFGLTPAEALACGVPVVAMDYSTLPEIVGPAGVLVPVDHLVENPYNHFWATPDEAAFAAAVIRLCQKPSERKALGKLGPGHVERSFNWDDSAAKFAAIIESVVAQEVAA